MGFRRFIGKSLKKVIQVEPVIRYLQSLGLITFVDVKRVILHTE